MEVCYLVLLYKICFLAYAMYMYVHVHMQYWLDLLISFCIMHVVLCWECFGSLYTDLSP